MSRRRDSVADTPLFAWGDALRAAQMRRRRLLGRGAALAVGGLALLCTIVLPPVPRLVWNASASAPVGLYAVTPDELPRVGSTVIARVPQRYRQLAATRRYLPLDVPLVKHIAAAGGDEICALGPRVLINGAAAAARRVVDGAGRAMPWWRGCVHLRDGQLFLLMSANPDSFDGRYFGPTERTDVIGSAHLLWAAP